MKDRDERKREASPYAVFDHNKMWAADYYNGNILVDGPYTFDRNTRYVDTASQGRLVALKFESNEVGGFFQGGKTLYDWEVGDVNP